MSGDLTEAQVLESATSPYWTCESLDAQQALEEVDPEASGLPAVWLMPRDSSMGVVIYKDESTYIGWGFMNEGVIRYGASVSLADLLSFINKKLPAGVPSIDVEVKL